MSPKAVTWCNIAAYLLFALLSVAAVFAFLFTGLAFGMATDACHDAACDASYHEGPAIATAWVGIFVVMFATLAMMVLGTARNRIVLVWPFVGLLGLGGVLALAFAVLH